MLKMPRKSLLVVGLLLFIAGGSLVAYGAFTVTSNTVHVNMQYTVTLSTFSVSNSAVTLNAAVLDNAIPVGAGINVDFYYSFNGGAWTLFTTQPTDAGGVAQAIYTVTIIGAYDFEAIANIP